MRSRHKEWKNLTECREANSPYRWTKRVIWYQGMLKDDVRLKFEDSNWGIRNKTYKSAEDAERDYQSFKNGTLQVSEI